MIFTEDFEGGHYDEQGKWIQTKFCFVYCGPDRCNCQRPDLIKETSMEFQKSLYQLRKISDDRWLALSEREPLFCFERSTMEEAAAIAEETLKNYEELKASETIKEFLTE